MRYVLAALILSAAATGARAGSVEAFFAGRPPSVGVVRGGAFGPDGADYYGEARTARADRVKERPTPHLSRTGIARAAPSPGSTPPAVVARPYRPWQETEKPVADRSGRSGVSVSGRQN